MTTEDKITFSVIAKQDEPDTLVLTVKAVRHTSVETIELVVPPVVESTPEETPTLVTDLQLVSISQQELEELNGYKADVKRIMNDFGIESDESAHEIVVRTSRAAVQLRDACQALSDEAALLREELAKVRVLARQLVDI